MRERQVLRGGKVVRREYIDDGTETTVETTLRILRDKKLIPPVQQSELVKNVAKVGE